MYIVLEAVTDIYLGNFRLMIKNQLMIYINENGEKNSYSIHVHMLSAFYWL